MTIVAQQYPARTDTNGITWRRPARRDGESISQWGWTSDPAQADPSYRNTDPQHPQLFQSAQEARSGA